MFVALLALPFALVACADILGIVDVPIPSSGDASNDGGAPFDSFVVPDGPFEGCNGGAEDCSNGIDDNCNGLVDCEDPVCQGAAYQCVNRAPLGWTLVAFAQTSGQGTLPGCSGAYGATTANGHTGLSAPAATCGCACQSPQATGTTCPAVAVNGYSGNTCNSAVDQSFNVNANACGDFNMAQGSINAAEGAPTSQGSCAANPSKTVPQIQWSNSQAACGYSAKDDDGGCAAGSQCVKMPSSSFDAKPCIAQAGDVACPGAPYTNKTTVMTTIADDRSCSACTCGASGGACSATITAYPSGGCTGTPITAQVNVCTAEAANAMSLYVNSISTTPAACTPSSSTPTGSATAGTPVTVCCP